MQQFALTVIRNSLIGMFSQSAIKLLSFAFSVAIVRHLGADAYGQYAAVLAFGAVFVFLADLGLSPYTVRAVARLRALLADLRYTSAIYGDVLALRLLLSLLTSALLIATALLTQRPAAMVGGIALGTLGLMMYGLQGASDAILAGFERLDISSLARVLNQLVFVALGAALLWFGLGYYGLIFANLLGIALATGFCWRAVRGLGVRPDRPDASRWPALLVGSLPFGAIAFTLGLSYKFDSVLLNLFWGDAETGYYNAVYSLVFSATVLSNAFNCALYPSMARQAAEDPQLLLGIFSRALRYLMAMSLPIAVGGWVLAGQLVPFLFTGSYEPAVPALQWVIWAIPLMFASEFMGYAVIVQNNESNVARAVIVSSSLNVALNLVLVPRFGFLGAAAMTVITEAVLVGQYLWVLRPLLARIDWSGSFLRPLFAALLMGYLVSEAQFLPVPASIAYGALSYVCLLLLFRVIGGEELLFLRSLLKGIAVAESHAGDMEGR